ncbi:MAG: chemotaxis protein [Burkholderiales bacterium RIFCSPLOWO2_02_FULL_57_36]|nr:MAG: chemotaxis protein [Burkholderiales bacterium RIFCSPLOWO2_02_FULL_57_36]
MTIRRTLWALPAISTAIFAISLSVGAYSTTLALSSIEATGSVYYPVLEHTSAMITEVRGVSTHFKSAIMEGDRSRFAVADNAAAAIRGRIEKISAVPGQQAIAQRLAHAFEEYYEPAKTGTQWMMGLAAKDEKAAFSKAGSAYNDLEADLLKTNDVARTEFAAGIKRSEEKVRLILSSTIASALIVILVLVVVSQMVVRSVWAKLGGEPEYAHAIANAVAAGDLSMDIQVDTKDGKSLLAAIKRMKQTLESMIGDIKNSGETIKTASAEIAAGSADLSTRTESQASSIEEIASAMDEMTSTVKKNVDHALNASRMSVSASDVAQRGGRAVEQVVLTMDGINKSAQKIADIIGVIDGIAFQTNILALNAAVEAARAGEQGRGFSVVASEVRTLAQRSAGAAKEIKELIIESVGRVNAGTETVQQAGTTMAEIVSSVKNVADIMNNITTASREQSSGIEEINRAIAQMDMMTQQNAAMVEQASAAAESLQEQAEVLATSLSAFNLSAREASMTETAVAQPTRAASMISLAYQPVPA